MIEKTYVACDESLPQAIAFVEQTMEELGCGMKAILQVSVCVEEMFVNVAHYAYPGGKGNVTLALWVQDGRLNIRLTDEGVPFDPLAKTDPDITLGAEERKIGGLGIFMVKKAMDAVYYTREKNQNIFTMQKEL